MKVHDKTSYAERDMSVQAQAIYLHTISKHIHFKEQHFNNSTLSVAI